MVNGFLNPFGLQFPGGTPGGNTPNPSGLLDPNFFLQRAQGSNTGPILGAIAAGLLSGRNFGQGLGLGLQNAQVVRNQQNALNQRNLGNAVNIALANRQFQEGQRRFGEQQAARDAAARREEERFAFEQQNAAVRNDLIKAQTDQVRNQSTIAKPSKFQNMTNPTTGETIAVTQGTPQQAEAVRNGFVISGAFGTGKNQKGNFTTKQINDATGVDSAWRAVDVELENFKQLLEQTGASVLPGQERDAIVQARTNIQLQLKELFNLGVLNGPDLELMEKLIFDPTSLSAIGSAVTGGFQKRANANIDRLRKSLKRRRDSVAGPILDQNQGVTRSPETRQATRQALPAAIPPPPPGALAASTAPPVAEAPTRSVGAPALDRTAPLQQPQLIPGQDTQVQIKDPQNPGQNKLVPGVTVQVQGPGGTRLFRIPQQSIEILRGDPVGLEKAFDEVYGQGAARAALGG